MKEILVVANRTIGGAPLLDAVRAHAAEPGGARFRLVVPQSTPSAGLVIYDEAVRESAQVRVDLALSIVAEEGIEATGEVGDADAFLATMDAVADRRPDAIIVSTHPATSSGWLRRDLVERIENASGLPVEHVTVDLENQRLPFKVTLVVANKTSTGDELSDRLIAKNAEEGKHVFIAVLPKGDGSGPAAAEARARLARMLDRLRRAGLVISGMIGDPDPYTATMNALELFTVDDIVISTLPGERSGWLRSDLIERVRGASRVPVEHVVAESAAESAAAAY
ncbi:MAG TPA: hypothetical protein VLZ06_10150 [Solirubrobacteraceae bacterium]|nr:hypothetical protein [Solirubrobacteraceae bacterium]